MGKRILMATGGTGGHIYPALAVAQTLRKQGAEVLFSGVFGPGGDKVRAQGFDFVELGARGFVAKGFIEKCLSVAAMGKAVFRARRAMHIFKPDVVAGFGGYAAFPSVLAALSLRIPTLIHDQNVVLGEANKKLLPHVRRVCVGFRQSLSAISKDKGVWTGTPFREIAQVDQISARQRFGLDPNKKTVFVFGGSQGSRALNAITRAFLESMSDQEKRTTQVLLGAGRMEYAQVMKDIDGKKLPVVVRDYIEDMGAAYAACDVALTRAGAGTVIEVASLGVPAVLVPYPGAKHHQLYNARVLESRQGTVIIQEKDLSLSIVRDKIFSVLQQDFSRIHLKEQVKDDILPDPEDRLAGEILRVAGI